MLKKFLKSSATTGITIIVSVLIIAAIVKAGNITPPTGTPTAKFYTLSEIYELIVNNNTTATEGGHSFTFSDSLTGTGRTLTEIYSALAGLITADKVKSGTTYLGVDGELAPDGTAAEADCLNTKTFYSGDSWTQKTGSLATQTLSAANDTVTAGNYIATTLSAVDTDLASDNIKSGITIFGVGGNTNVVDTSSGTVTSNAQIRSAYIAFSGGAQYIGSIADCSSEGSQSCYTTGTYYAGTQQTIDNTATSQSAGYYSAFDLVTNGDAELATANIKSGITIFGIPGNSNVVNTSSGNATTSQILLNYKAWVDGQEITGSIADCGDGESSCYVASGKRYANECGESATSTQTDCYVDTTARYLTTSLCDSAKENQCFVSTDNSYYAFGAECSNSATSTQTNCYIDDTAKYIGGNACSAASSTGYCFMNTATFTDMDSDLIQGNIKSGVEIFNVTGDYTATAAYTWTKEGAGSWEGVNEDLDWAKEIGGTDWWSSQTYSYCGVSACTNDGTLVTAANYAGPPGGWNGSNDYTNFNNSALQNYEVITADSTDLGNCVADAGDLVFPDGSVWDKSAASSYSVKLTGCDSNNASSTTIWSAAVGTGSQYAYARNAPSALSIADAWDGKKNLTTGVNSTHSYSQDGINNDYYDRPSQSWYANTGDGAGISRLPMIEEYERARQGTSDTTASLLHGATNWAQYNWSAEQRPDYANNARSFYPNSGYAYSSTVNAQTCRLWVVAAQ